VERGCGGEEERQVGGSRREDVDGTKTDV